ncbi:MAG: MBL fold metallo-hydrolase [Thermoprotei archaeon]
MYRLKYGGGLLLELNNKRIIFDPVQGFSGDLILISHAHSDHIRGINDNDNSVLVLSPPTMDIIFQRNRKLHRSVDIIQPNDFKSYNDVIIEAYNAGHVLGSLEFLLEFYDLRIGYTGDFNIYGSIVDDPAYIMRDLDVLVIESTYGRPDYNFPPRSFIYEKILSWIATNIKDGRTVVIGVYPLGKAQELTYLLNKEFGKVFVSEKIHNINKVFDRHKFKLNYKLIEQGMNSIFDGSELVIATTSEVSKIVNMINLQSANKAVGSICTGWSLNYHNSNNGVQYFPLSSHSDFKGLLKYVEMSRPKMVYTLYGFSYELAEYINRKLNIKAKSLDSKIEDFSYF